MNYYEELGLRPSASAEEIRQAYRELARLLHPDQQRDEGLRLSALLFTGPATAGAPAQRARIMLAFERVCVERRPDWVVGWGT